MEAAPSPPAESVPFDVLLSQMESAYHRSLSENVMLHARIDVRDRQLAEKDAQIQRLLAHAGLATALPAAEPEGQHDNQA